jgi:hypothetical protein
MSHGHHPPLCCVVIVHSHITSSIIVCIQLVAPPPRVAEGKGQVTIAIPSAHSKGEGNMVMVTCASPLVDIVACPEVTVGVPHSHPDVVWS